jgi:apolipoprotein N-acyltransferase
VGVVCGVFGFYWLLNMLQTFSGFPAWICALFMLILCAYQAGLFALLGWLYARGVQRGWASGVVFAVAFVASETVYPLLFPFTFGATMHEVYPIVQMAELGGPILVALTVLASNWALALVLGRYIESRRTEEPLSIAGAFRAVGWRRWVPLLSVPVVASCYGLVRIVQVDEAVRQAEKVRVGIVQANMSLSEKRVDRDEGLKRHTDLTRKLVKDEKIDLVVWPETSVAGAVNEKKAFQHYRKTVTGRLRVPAIVGAVLYRRVDDARRSVLFNSALISDEQGRIQDRYDKQFLLLFGEYLPFGDKFPILHEWSPHSGRFSPGTSFEPLRFRGHDIATFICYEDIVPSFVNKLMKHGEPELLVNMTNDAWFGDTSEPWEHMALAKLRAVEQRRFFVRSTNSGISGFVDPVGRLTKRTETFKKAAIAQDVAWLKLGSPYRIWGNIPWWILSVVAFAFAFIDRKAFSRNS